jgi:hypothetical protein
MYSEMEVRINVAVSITSRKYPPLNVLGEGWLDVSTSMNVVKHLRILAPPSDL